MRRYISYDTDTVTDTETDADEDKGTETGTDRGTETDTFTENTYKDTETDTDTDRHTNTYTEIDTLSTICQKVSYVLTIITVPSHSLTYCACPSCTYVCLPVRPSVCTPGAQARVKMAQNKQTVKTITDPKLLFQMDAAH